MIAAKTVSLWVSVMLSYIAENRAAMGLVFCHPERSRRDKKDIADSTILSLSKKARQITEIRNYI